MPPGPQPTATPTDPTIPVTLDEYLTALQNFATRRLMSSGTSQQNSLAYTQMARLALARSPYIRDMTIAILQDAERGATVPRNVRSTQEPPRQQTRTKTRNPFDDINYARNFGTPYGNGSPQKSEDPFAAQQKAIAQEAARKESFRKSIETRIAAMRQQLQTPVGQQFLLARNSAFFNAIIPQPATNEKPTTLIVFEAVSNTEGGIIAFRTESRQVPAGRVNSPYESPFKEVHVAGTESFFVRGYIKHVSTGDQLRLKVREGGKVTINNTDLQEYIFVAEDAPRR